MASLGHVAVGLVAGRTLADSARIGAPRSRGAWWGCMVALAILALSPDLDYLGVALGVPNVGPCGHRGASHSLVPVLAAGLLAALVAPRLDLPRTKTALLCALVVASHPLLDAMTLSTRGVPILWPLSFHRFEMPWRPIPDAPCGLAYLSLEGLEAAAVEALQFLPLLLLAFRRRAPVFPPWPSAATPARRALSGLQEIAASGVPGIDRQAS